MQEQGESKLDVKQAVMTAMQWLRDVYSDEKLANVGLEEVAADENVWLVTVGFSRPWDFPRSRRPGFDPLGDLFPREVPVPEREYKRVKVDAATGQVIGMEMRLV